MIALGFAFSSFAQTALFMGKIVDEDGNASKGALFQLKWKSDMIETRSGDDGIFYTQLIPEGHYKVGILADGKYYKMRHLHVTVTSEKKFYVFKIKGERLFVDIEGKDGYLKSRLSAISKLDPRIYGILPVGDLYIIQSKAEHLGPPDYKEHLLFDSKK